LDPFRLNQALGYGPAIPGVQNDASRRLIVPAFSRDMASEKRILAVLAAEVDLRMMMQLAAFTIHGTPEPLELRIDSTTFLVRITIPAADKPALQQDLGILGLRRSTLFPDLQNLARELAETSFHATGAASAADGIPAPGATS
jgi:hypothetical protein